MEVLFLAVVNNPSLCGGTHSCRAAGPSLSLFGPPPVPCSSSELQSRGKESIQASPCSPAPKRLPAVSLGRSWEVFVLEISTDSGSDVVENSTQTWSSLGNEGKERCSNKSIASTVRATGYCGLTVSWEPLSGSASFILRIISAYPPGMEAGALEDCGLIRSHSHRAEISKPSLTSPKGCGCWCWG